MKTKKWVLVKNFNGEPKDEDLELQEENLSEELKEDEILLEAVYLSVDPYMRPFSENLKTPTTMIGEQLSRVIKTRNRDFPVETLVLSNAGWTSHFVSKGENLNKIPFDFDNLPISYSLGVLGMPGAAAYFGIKLLEPKKGETLIINAAAGAVGSIVGQLAKINGAKVIAFVGREDKVKICREEFGFDHVFNYKDVNFSDAIIQVAPDGIEMFFDNVGGDWYHTLILKHMKKHGRVVICGSISTYNEKRPKHYPQTKSKIIQDKLKVNELVSSKFKKDWPRAFKELKEYIKEGKLIVKETEYHDIETMREAFYGLFKGENIGKAIIKA